MSSPARPAPVEAVIFDFYGTLARLAPGLAAPETIVAGRGYQWDPDVARTWSTDALDGHDLSEHAVSRETYEQFLRHRRRRHFEAIGVRDEDMDALLDEAEAFMRSFRMEAYPEVSEVIAALRDGGVVLGLCSNWDWDLEPHLAQSGLEGCFDVAVTSARVGYRKPHPRIYEVVLEQLGTDRARTLFVGDSWHPDVLGPRAAGMPTVHVWRGDRRGPVAPLPPVPPGVVRVPDLSGLPSLAQRR